MTLENIQLTARNLTNRFLAAVAVFAFGLFVSSAIATNLTSIQVNSKEERSWRIPSS